jgi:LEA14-like dessication related protein
MMVAVTTMAVAATAACSSVAKQSFLQPDVQVKDVKVTALGLTGGSVDVVLNVNNPNNFRLDASRLTYNLIIDTVRFASGSLDQRMTVESGQNLEVRVPVNFTYSGVGEAGRQLINMGSVPYRMTGDFTVATILGNFTVPYDRAGRFSPMAR